jgi:transposase
MVAITTVGLDIAKSVFQVHGVDAHGIVVVRRQLKRRYVLAFFKKLPPCLVGIEACATSHHWSRELQALGHTVRLIPPAYVKPYVKRQKNDAADAEAICEAVQRPSMRFVPTKTPEQQSCLMLHRTRHLFIRQQTAIINTIRAHLAELGIVAPVGRNGVEELLYAVADQRDDRIPEVARVCLEALGALLGRLKAQILEFDRQINAWHRSNEMSRRLDELPGVGPALATALVASVADPKAFRSGRDFSAWIGLVPKQNSSGGREKLGSIHQARRPLPAQPVHGRCAGGHPLRQNPRAQTSPLACPVTRAAADEGRGDRAGQQNRAHGLGDDGHRRALQGTPCAGPLGGATRNEIASVGAV